MHFLHDTGQDVRGWEKTVFGLQLATAIGLLLILYGIYRTLMHSENPTARMLGNVCGGVFAVLACVLTLFVRPMVLDSDIITSDSMKPTLLVGDRLLADKATYRRSMPKRGDIITFSYPSRTRGLADDILIKRVIGLPGDTVEITNGAVYRNDLPLDEPYISAPVEYNIPALKVSDGSLFVLGDNRNESDDSHVWGLLDRKRVIARATFRFWPLSRMGGIH